MNLITLTKYYRRLRKRYFSHPRPQGTYFVVEGSAEDVKRALGKHYFGPNWTTSYYKRGEDLNLSKPEYTERIEHPDIRWWQTHVRGWEKDGVVEVTAHYEPEPTEHPEAHLEGDMIDDIRGETMLQIVLNQSELNIVGEREYAGE